MKILYFTSAIKNDDFKIFSKTWDIPLNTSYQNFHNKLIRSLSLNNEVTVISLRPFSKQHCAVNFYEEQTIIENHITWHYLKVKGNKTKRFFSYKRQINKYKKEFKKQNAIIFTDTINIGVSIFSKHFSKKWHLPCIGICTDSPSNITGTTKSYSKLLFKLCRDYSGYVCLTSALNKLYNIHNKPNIIFEGIVDYHKENKNIDLPHDEYFFFGGALLEKYGIYNLIEAFNDLNKKNIKLLICGHHEENRLKLEISKNPNIIYLHSLAINDVLYYEINALANINPRPFNEDLDRFSVPSKTIEYLSSGTLTISVRNSKLQPLFDDCAIWCKNGTVKELKDAMLKAISMGKYDRVLMGKHAKEKAIKLYSISSINKQLFKLLKQFQ